MFQEKFNLELLRILSEFWYSRVVSVDIETNAQGRFFQDEFILGVSLAARTSGNLTASKEINVNFFVLEDETEDAEISLLGEVDDWLFQYRPLGVIGYAHRGYDVPLLISKIAKYWKRFSQKPWKLRDALRQAAHIDLYDVLKKKFNLKRLAEAINSKIFKELPLLQQKHLVSDNFEQKGKDIYRLWKTDRSSFKEYSEGDAVNPLLIAEYFIKNEDYDL